MSKPNRPAKQPTGPLAGARPEPKVTVEDGVITSVTITAPSPSDALTDLGALGVSVPKRPIIHCRDCFFGQTLIDNARVCRARRPDSKAQGHQVVIGRGTRSLAEALFPAVAGEEWCGDGTLDGWPVQRP